MRRKTDKPARFPAVLCAGFGLLIAGCIAPPGPVGDIDPEHTGLHFLAVNSWAARQRSAAGRRLQTVEYFDGQVYVGFGDWRANTGPIAVTSWDIEAADWQFHFSAATEAIERFRPLVDGLLLPYTDPIRSADFARGPVWHEARATNERRESFYHVFDAVETPAGLFLAGTRRPTAEPQVLRWDGEAWSTSLLVTGKADWIWFAAVLGDALVVQTETQGSFRLENGSWTQAPALFPLPRTRAVVSADGRVAGISRERGRAGYLQTSNGIEHSRETVADALDLNIDQDTGWIYLLRSDRIERSRDLLNWQHLPVPVPAGASAIDVAKGHVWIGTDNSSLWSASLPE